MEVERKLVELGFEVAEPNPSIGNFVPAVRVENVVFVSGNLPRLPDGSMAATGKLGREVSVYEGYVAARQCVVNYLSSARSIIGDLEGTACGQAAGIGQQRSGIWPAAGGWQRCVRSACGAIRRKRPPRAISRGHGRAASASCGGSGDDPGSGRLIRVKLVRMIIRPAKSSTTGSECGACPHSPALSEPVSL